jgi:hypothetical protein
MLMPVSHTCQAADTKEGCATSKLIIDRLLQLHTSHSLVPSFCTPACKPTRMLMHAKLLPSPRFKRRGCTLQLHHRARLTAAIFRPDNFLSSCAACLVARGLRHTGFHRPADAVGCVTTVPHAEQVTQPNSKCMTQPTPVAWSSQRSGPRPCEPCYQIYSLGPRSAAGLMIWRWPLRAVATQANGKPHDEVSRITSAYGMPECQPAAMQLTSVCTNHAYRRLFTYI